MRKRIRSWSWYFSSLACFVLAFLLAPVHEHARAEGGEYRVKAAFLYNFLKFTEWPPAAFPPDSTSLTLCFLGENPFGENLDDLKSKSVGGKRLAVRYLLSAPNAKGCHLLFIAASEKGNLAQTLEALRGLPLLTIGDSEGFAQKGVMINMYIEEERVRFEVNLKTVKKAGLRLDSRLLKLARIVQE
ncbi:MAG: YfiR family protein [Alphaproteobacteria bacterium]|uniref:YfiR family protein n=1 Tax=Candidatus Nitrobium versatile TaxID=2884831 RepID=A0A953JE74_9BACT|nr:YfiR family protein [Candidatus Nitrobium versatile]